MSWPPKFVNSRRFVRLEEAFPPFGDSSDPFTQVNLSDNQIYTLSKTLSHIRFSVPSGGTATVVLPADDAYLGRMYAIQAQASSVNAGTLKLWIRDKFLVDGKKYELTLPTDQMTHNKTLIFMYTRYGWFCLNGFQAIGGTIV